MVESLSAREWELLDAISRAQLDENAAAARKVSAIREFALARAESLTSVGEVEPERVERKIVAEVAVACRTSPAQGRRRLHAARDLHLGLDYVRGLFAAGELAEDKVLEVVAVTAHLDPGERTAVDERLAAKAVEQLGVRRVHDLATRLAMEIAPDKAQARARAARSQRHVRVRLAADGMAGPGRAPARRTGRRLLRRAAPGGQRAVRHGRVGHPQPRADPRRHPRGAVHRAGHRDRRGRRGADPGAR